MSRTIHARVRESCWRYRLWSDAVDAYVTPELDREALYAELHGRNAARDIESFLDRAHDTGTSARGEPDHELNGPWKTERCETCRRTHHDYLSTPRATCVHCGKSAADAAHAIPCSELICNARPDAAAVITEVVAPAPVLPQGTPLYQTRIARRLAGGDMLQMTTCPATSLGGALATAAREISEAHKNVDDVFDVIVCSVPTDTIVLHAVKRDNGSWHHVDASVPACFVVQTP